MAFWENVANPPVFPPLPPRDLPVAIRCVACRVCDMMLRGWQRGKASTPPLPYTTARGLSALRNPKGQMGFETDDMPFDGADSVAFFSPPCLSRPSNHRVNLLPPTAEALTLGSQSEGSCTAADPWLRGPVKMDG